LSRPQSFCPRIRPRWHTAGLGSCSPATILTDDPFVADEISLPQVTVTPPGPDGAQSTAVEIDLSKRITPDTGVIIGNQWQRLQPSGLPAVTGFGPLRTEGQYQLFINGPRSGAVRGRVSSVRQQAGEERWNAGERILSRCRIRSFYPDNAASGGKR
jgi:hypothetical protein